MRALVLGTAFAMLSSAPSSAQQPSLQGAVQAARLFALIDGMRCVDCGRLEMARTTEAMTALLISVNSRYKAHAGVRLTSLPEKLWD